MPTKAEFHGYIDHDGTTARMIIHLSKEVAQRTWEALGGKVGKRLPITVTFQEDEPGIEHWMRKYYWGYVVPPITQAANDAGHDWDNNATNEFCKRLRLKPNKHGKYTTVGMSKAAFEKYVEETIAWAADFFGIDFTTPKQAGMFPEAEL